MAKKKEKIEKRTIEKKLEGKKNWAWSITIIAVIVLLVILSFYIKFNKGKIDAEQLAKCLTAHGIKMYGEKDCGWCARQKNLFGDAFQYVTYVECSVSSICEEKGIEGYPTWEINGQLDAGFKTLKGLAKISGC